MGDRVALSLYEGRSAGGGLTWLIGPVLLCRGNHPEWNLGQAILAIEDLEHVRPEVGNGEAVEAKGDHRGRGSSGIDGMGFEPGLHLLPEVHRLPVRVDD